ncbi:MAG: hypothetical protein JWM53_2329, partial [bacterium]|nr:hypothetical protein [bacterium]
MKLLDELADCACEAESRAEFRHEATASLHRAIGFDGVAWGPLPPPGGSVDAQYYSEHVPPASLVAMMNDEGALADIGIAERFLHARGVAIDGGFGALAKRRSSFFARFLAPLGIRTYVSTLMAPSYSNALRLTREAAAFGERELAILSRVRPLLRVAEGRFDARPLAADVLASLTPRQRVIVQHVARGLTNAEIARALRVSINTVRNRLADVFTRLGVSTRAELVAVALKHLI